MKVQSLTAITRSVHQVREKSDQGGDHSSKHNSQQQQQKNPNGQNTPTADDQRVETAVSAFSLDLNNQGAGIHAEKVGTGPGLKVVLKDGSGAIIRQFTGEEFLKIRESRDLSRTSGRIFDQKV